MEEGPRDLFHSLKLETVEASSRSQSTLKLISLLPAAGLRGRVRPRPEPVLAVGLPEPDRLDARRGEADAGGPAVLPQLPGARRPLLVGRRRLLHRPGLRRRHRPRLPARRHRDHLQDEEQVPPELRARAGRRVVGLSGGVLSRPLTVKWSLNFTVRDSKGDRKCDRVQRTMHTPKVIHLGREKLCFPGVFCPQEDLQDIEVSLQR